MTEFLDILTEPYRLVLGQVDAWSCALMFCLGALVGSFLNVCIGRMPVGKSVVFPGSACTHCGTPIPGWLNVPILSFALLGGACGTCSSPLSIRYLLLEVLSGLLWVGLFVRFGGVGPELLVDLTLVGVLVVVFFMDLDTWLILDELNLFGAISGLVLRSLVPLPPVLVSTLYEPAAGFPMSVQGLLESVLGLVVGWALFKSIAFVGALVARQEALGQGDVKLAAVLGAYLGPSKGLLALFLSFPLGALCVLPLVWLRGQGSKTPIPFGTFMALAALAVILYGDFLMSVLLPLPS